MGIKPVRKTVRKINGRQTANLKTTQKVQDLVNWAEFKLLLVENIVGGAWVDLRSVAV